MLVGASEDVPATAREIYVLRESNISGSDILPGDFMAISVIRGPNSVYDTASSGSMAIMGAEFTYVAKVRVV